MGPSKREERHAPETGTVLDEFLPLYRALHSFGIAPPVAKTMTVLEVAAVLGVKDSADPDDPREMLAARQRAAAQGLPAPTWDDGLT